MTHTNGLIFAHCLDGKGGTNPLEWAGVRNWSPQDGPLWMHLERSDPYAAEWLKRDSGIDPLVLSAMLAEDPRPRSFPHGEGLLMILRGVNTTPGAEPDDMVSVRIWVARDRIVSVRKRRLISATDVSKRLLAGNGPRDSAETLLAIAEALAANMAPVIDELDEKVSELEDRVVSGEKLPLRSELSEMRRQAIRLRRYISPQRDVLARFQTENLPWLTEMHKAMMREVTDRTTRIVEDLEEARERAAVTQEEIANRVAEQMNRTMFLLSIVATIFLPLGLLTGLLGINVGGMPGADAPVAFWVVCALLVVLGFGEAWLLKKMRIF
ncbi:MAG TPA: zinc transporter ZntB [Planctomycetota bacterium]